MQSRDEMMMTIHCHAAEKQKETDRGRERERDRAGALFTKLLGIGVWLKITGQMAVRLPFTFTYEFGRNGEKNQRGAAEQSRCEGTEGERGREREIVNSFMVHNRKQRRLRGKEQREREG